MNESPTFFLLRVSATLSLFATFFGQRDRCTLIAGFQCARFPVIQLMGNTVAVSALGEAGHHASRVRHSVTALAGRNRLVLVLVAGHTEYVLVFRVAAGKHFESALVAGGTHLVRGIGGHEYCRRHVGLVAFFTLRGNHVGAVRFVALGTEGYLAMDIMAEAACQAAMLALDLLQLDDLLGVACQTLIGDIVGQFDNFWGMWIIMAAHAAGQIVVRLAGMTLAAGRDNLFH